MKTIYFAGPLFTLAEKDFNLNLSSAITKLAGNELSIILPQNFSLKYPKDDRFFGNLFRECIESIENCDMVVAILDGPDADSGTCVELGYAYARNKPVIGVRTDFRISEDQGLNLMVSQLCKTLISDFESDIQELAKKIVREIQEIK